MDTTWDSAASRLTALAAILLRRWKQRIPAFGCQAIELEPLFMLMPVNPPPELVKFLCAVTPVASVHLRVFSLLSPTDLVEYQIDSAPICGNNQFGLMGLGYWTGRSDGDAWIYDLRTAKIHSLDIGSGDQDSLEGVLEGCYLQFHSFGEWVGYVVSDAVRRGWLSESDV